MDEQPDNSCGGHIVGPIPLDALVFPDRCVRCGKPAPFEAKVKKHTGLGFPLAVVFGCCLPFLHLPLTREVELRVPVCRWCREWHQGAYVLALLGTLLVVLGVGVAGIFLGVWLAMEHGLNGWGVFLYVVAVVAAVLFIMWFGGTRLIDIANRRSLGISIHKYDAADKVVFLAFRDPALAEEISRCLFHDVDSPA
ncbi:MAG TPA: hypothetical protein VMX57_06340 [Planctomycetota bacterium]|nr:hypothetical protein [Planctomycetota bacterium]